LRELATQNHLERERLRGLIQVTPKGEQQFWQEYLGSYQMLAKVPDYRDYIELIQRLLGVPRKSQVVLDAGCGVGYYGAWLLAHLSAAGQNASAGDRVHSFGGRYVGLDFIDSALRQAIAKHKEIVDSLRQGETNGQGGLGRVALQLQYLQADLNSPIPLADGSVDKICCSLVLPYVQDPLATLNELVRVLTPGGRIVVTSLKPYADLSEIYRNFVSQAKSEQDIVEARRLLSNAGRIRQKEGEGHYHFFSERELMALMIAAGLERVKVYRSFGNQTNVTVAAKRTHAGPGKR
jgi:SAM-dependent methyltransferase